MNTVVIMAQTSHTLIEVEDNNRGLNTFNLHLLESSAQKRQYNINQALCTQL